VQFSFQSEETHDNHPKKKLVADLGPCGYLGIQEITFLRLQVEKKEKSDLTALEE